MGDESTKRLTMGQAVIEFLKNQYVERDDFEQPVAEVSDMDSVREARAEWEKMRAKERYFL